MMHSPDMSLVLKVFMLVLSIQLLTCLSLICHEGHKVEINKGAPFCDLCDNGTFIGEKNHNKTKCNPCTVCETGHEIQPCDDHTDTVCCDQMSTTPSVRNVAEEAFRILLIVVYTVSLFVLLSGFVLVKCKTLRIERIKLLKEYLADKGDVLATSIFAVMFVLVVIFIFIYSVPTENSDTHIFILVLHVFAALCVCGTCVIAILCLLLIQHHSEKLSFDAELTSLHSEQAHECSVTHTMLNCVDSDCSCSTSTGHTTSPSSLEIPATHSLVNPPLQQ